MQFQKKSVILICRDRQMRDTGKLTRKLKFAKSIQLAYNTKDMTHERKKKIGKLNFIVIKDFYSMEDTVNRMRSQATGLEKILAKNKPLKEV